MGPRWIVIGLALQNLGRRGTRTALLVAAVAIASAVAFAGTVMTSSIGTSLEVGFSRLGADLMVVAADALTNITPALLTVEPTDTTVAADLFAGAALPGLARVAAQRVFRTESSGLGGTVDLIGFDPESDFTIRPWISQRLDRPMAADDVIVGAAGKFAPGSNVTLFGKTFRVYAKLAATGSGTHERGIFLPSSALVALAPEIRRATGAVPASLEPDRVTGFLIELAPGATELQTRFALLARHKGIKVVGGGSLMTGIRQGLTTLVGGMAVLIGVMLASIGVLVGTLFSASIAERRRELGLLKAIGARRYQIVGTLVIEAMIATAAGGLAGVLFGLLLLRFFERSLVYHLAQMGIPFIWLGSLASIGVGAACVGGAALVGALGAVSPAWRAGREDPYDLIQGPG